MMLTFSCANQSTTLDHCTIKANNNLLIETESTYIMIESNDVGVGPRFKGYVCSQESGGGKGPDTRLFNHLATSLPVNV